MVRELFVMAREAAPSIIFMDEIDSIGSSRVEGSEGGDSEVQRTMLELLNQLDGFEPTQNIKVGAATLWGGLTLSGVLFFEGAVRRGMPLFRVTFFVGPFCRGTFFWVFAWVVI